MTEHIHVIIPCAGSGSRFNSDFPKQYALIDEHTMLWHTINAIIAVNAIKSVWIVVNSTDDYVGEYVKISPKIHIAKVGASTRAESVLNGLLQLEGIVDANDWILVHDAARCCIKPELITKLIMELKNDSVGGILAIGAVDTIKQVQVTVDNYKIITKTIDRNLIYLAQTPQMFRYGILKHALLNVDLQLITDEASAVEMSGESVKIIEGDASNIKVTYQQDIVLARAILNNTMVSYSSQGF